MNSNEFEKELVAILCFWSVKMVDNEHGGFYGKMTGNNVLVPDSDKGVVLNARILWTFSAAYKQIGMADHKSLADRAFQYIMDHFIDLEYGGVVWMVDSKGKVRDRKKQIYAQSFVIYALVEYYKISKSNSALQSAKDIFRLIETHAFDSVRNGYFEARDREWQGLDDVRLSEKDLNAEKTMNTHLHILEAYTNLLRVWKDERLKLQLRNLIELMMGPFLSDSSHFHLFYDKDWNLLSHEVSYGHDIEGSWLLCEAAEVLGDEKLFMKVSDVAIKMVDAALEGIDSDGALMNEGNNNAVIDTDKHWWPQAEALVGLVNAWQLTKEDKYLLQVISTWDFIKNHLIDPEYGEWHWRVSRTGQNDFKEDKAGPWKCPYHNGRAMIEIMNRI